MNFPSLQWNHMTTFQKEVFVATSKHLMARVRQLLSLSAVSMKGKKWAGSTGMNWGDTSRSCFSSATGPLRQTSLVLGSLWCSFVPCRHCKVTGNTQCMDCAYLLLCWEPNRQAAGPCGFNQCIRSVSNIVSSLYT